MSDNVTKEGIEVCSGQVWRDLDKRMHGRKCRVGKVVNGRAEMFTLVGGLSGKRTFVSVRRMHKSGTGWELIAPATNGTASQTSKGAGE